MIFYGLFREKAINHDSGNLLLKCSIVQPLIAYYPGTGGQEKERLLSSEPKLEYINDRCNGKYIGFYSPL